MRLLAAILVLVLTVFPASGGFARPAAHAAAHLMDCQHQAAIPATGHDHHGGSPVGPAEPDSLCCLTHCIAVGSTLISAVASGSSVAADFHRADEGSAGMDIEPAIPPPRG